MDMKKYILFGAGKMAEHVINIIGKENIKYIVDNNNQKHGIKLNGISVYLFIKKIEECKLSPIVISVSSQYQQEIKNQLELKGITNYITWNELQTRIIKQKIENRSDNFSVYQKTINWIRKNTIEGRAIICNTGKKKGYPEVTGYYIPTLIRWGYRDMAIKYAEWLLNIQKQDGSWYDTDDQAPYIFDTAQILKGLLAVWDIYPDKKAVEQAIVRGVDWILSCMTQEGRLITPDETCWGDNKDMCSELIHLYCLSPIIEAGNRLHNEEYGQKAKRILEYYKNNYYEKIMNFSLLSHFYAYVMESLVDLGEIDMAREAMQKIVKLQKKTGAVPAYNNVDWVCSTGLFQFSLVWFRLGDVEHGNKAFEYACKLQNESGGWFGSYLAEYNPDEVNDYFPQEEISWANKYFLDALYYKNKVEFNLHADEFLLTIPKADERYIEILNVVKQYARGAYIADVGCGKGRYLKNLLDDLPDNQYYGIDISTEVMKKMQAENVVCKEGTLTYIPYEDGKFSVTYTCEALEHAIDIESAIREMCRVTKQGGKIVIIDKNKNSYGALEIGEWEQWPDEKELQDIMEKYCENVSVKTGLKYENMDNPDLFTVWIGTVR